MNVSDDERSIITWTAGGLREPSAEGLVDEAKLLALLGLHRLFHRFVTRVRQCRPRWCPRSLLIRAWTECRRIEAHTKLQISAATEVSRAIADAGGHAVFVKGCNAFALTGYKQHLHLSGDLDLLCDQPDLLRTVFENLGYVDDSGHGPAGHELFNVRRGGVRMEVHRYFPFWSYPQGIVARHLDPALHPALWVQDFAHNSRSEYGLIYEDACGETTTGATSETAKLTVPNPTLAALILCAHSFKNFLDIHPSNLSEIADIRDLAQHPAFSAVRFLSLAERFAARDAVAFAASLMRAHLGSDTLPQFPEDAALDSGRWCFPQAVGGWACLSSAQDLLQPRSLGALFQKLGAASVPATPAIVPNIYTVFQPNSPGNPITRIILRSKEAHRFPFRFSVTWEAADLKFVIDLPEPLRTDEEDYHLCFQTEKGIDIFSANIGRRGAELEQGKRGQASLSASASGGYSLQVSMPTKRIHDRMPDLRQPISQLCGLPLLFTVAKWERDGYTGSVIEDPAIVIPLLITRQVCEE